MMIKIFGMKEIASLILFVSATIIESSANSINQSEETFPTTSWSEKLLTPFPDIVFKNTAVNPEKIKKLNFSFMNLVGLSNKINQFTELEELDLSFNKLTSLPSFKNLKKLRKLSIENNLFEVIPPEICQLENLEDLNISGNKIRELPYFLSQMKTLKKVDITGNPLERVDESISKMDPLPEFKIELIGIFQGNNQNLPNSFRNFVLEYERRKKVEQQEREEVKNQLYNQLNGLAYNLRYGQNKLLRRRNSLRTRLILKRHLENTKRIINEKLETIDSSEEQDRTHKRFQSS